MACVKYEVYSHETMRGSCFSDITAPFPLGITALYLCSHVLVLSTFPNQSVKSPTSLVSYSVVALSNAVPLIQKHCSACLLFMVFSDYLWAAQYFKVTAGGSSGSLVLPLSAVTLKAAYYSLLFSNVGFYTRGFALSTLISYITYIHSISSPNRLI